MSGGILYNPWIADALIKLNNPKSKTFVHSCRYVVYNFSFSAHCILIKKPANGLLTGLCIGVLIC
jgi:hypothetical protein